MSNKLSPNRSCFNKEVQITRSGERGTVTGFSVHSRQRQPQFYVEYKSGDGRAVEAWFFEDALTLLS